MSFWMSFPKIGFYCAVWFSLWEICSLFLALPSWACVPFPVTHRRLEGIGKIGRQRIFSLGTCRSVFYSPLEVFLAVALVCCDSTVDLPRKSQFASLTQFAVLDKVGKENGVQQWDLFCNNLIVFLDINECVLHPNICGTATCKNTQGRYECECPEGYTYNSTSKNCEGGSLPPAPTFYLFHLPLPLFFFLSTAIPNSASHLLVYLLIFIFFIKLIVH